MRWSYYRATAERSRRARVGVLSGQWRNRGLAGACKLNFYAKTPEYSVAPTVEFSGMTYPDKRTFWMTPAGTCLRPVRSGLAALVAW
jgi:hypothetical protein